MNPGELEESMVETAEEVGICAEEEQPTFRRKFLGRRDQIIDKLAASDDPSSKRLSEEDFEPAIAVRHKRRRGERKAVEGTMYLKQIFGDKFSAEEKAKMKYEEEGGINDEGKK